MSGREFDPLSANQKPATFDEVAQQKVLSSFGVAAAEGLSVVSSCLTSSFSLLLSYKVTLVLPFVITRRLTLAAYSSANIVQAERHCLQVYSWGSSILSDELMCSSRYQY